jgi:hypothetical protein
MVGMPIGGGAVWTQAMPEKLRGAVPDESGDWLVVFHGDLQAEERAIFRALSAANQFQHADAVLLGAFCRAAAIERQAAGLIRSDLANVSPAVLKAFAEATRAMAALAGPLLLSPESCRPRDPRGRPRKPRLTAGPARLLDADEE